MRTFKSKLGGFFPRVGADVVQLAAKARHDLLAREDVQKLREILWYPDEYVNHDPDNPTSVFDHLAGFLKDLPDEGFKLFPWVVREFKKGASPHTRGGTLGGIWWRNAAHSGDIVEQAIRWLVWCREHNTPMPDMMSKQFTINEMQNWVYEMNAQNAKEEWVDSEPVYTFPDGWHIDRVGPQDISKEGEIMGHCVGGYYSEARDGRIYSLRDPKGQPHVTVELSGNPSDDSLDNLRNGRRIDILQQQGKSNQRPIDEYQQRLDGWYQHLNENGWDIENREDREPEWEYVDHPNGPFPLNHPEDVIDYHRAMTDRWDRDDFFGRDEEPEFDHQQNAYIERMPRPLQPGQGGLPARAAEFVKEIERGENGDIDTFVQGLWMANRHMRAQNWDDGEQWKQDWQQCIDAAKQAAEQYGPKPQKAKQPTLFEPNDFIQKPPIPTEIQAMIRYMEQLKNAPHQYEEPTTNPVQNPRYGEPGEGYWLLDENGRQLQEPGTRTRYVNFPDSGDYPVTDWNDYFNHIGMPGMSMAGTFARYIKTTNAVEKLVKLAAYPEAPTCPYDGHELDIHFHGGVECPQCGSEFELGQNDRLLPSLNTLSEDAAGWPDTLPAHWAMKRAALDPLNQHLMDKLGPEALHWDEEESPWVAGDPHGRQTSPDDPWPDSLGIPPYLYRAMSEDHFQQSLKDGVHQSDERGNWIGQAKDDPHFPAEQAIPEGTVAGLFAQPGYLHNSPNGIGRIVKIRTQPEDEWQRHWEGDDEGSYYQTFKPIPTDRFEAWTDPINISNGWDNMKIGASGIAYYPFLYHPESGWLTWGDPNGYHDPIHARLHQEGTRAPDNTVHGVWWAHNNETNFYGPEMRRLAPQELEKHRGYVAQNAPVSSPEAPGAAETDSWSPGPDSVDWDDWTPVGGL